MFDYIAIKCPHCTEELLEQSKTGYCLLDTIEVEKDDTDASLGVVGKHQCPCCGNYYAIERISKPSYRVKPIDKAEWEEDNYDYEDC